MSLLTTLIELMEQPDISDVHLSPDERLWVRRNGDLEPLEAKCNVTQLNQWLSQVRYQTNSALSVVQSRGGQDDFAANLSSTRIRCQAYISKGQINLAIRKLSEHIPPLAQLGLPASLPPLLTYPSGLLLVVGATGSGKSTTLASCVDHLNRTLNGHIVTLEDPVEYIHHDQSCRVRQRHVGSLEDGSDCATFAQGVVAAMRQDPDVILVGEVRDQATMQACLSAAQTGHLVLATLHTNSAVESVERCLAFFPDRERELARSVLSATLLGVAAQRLVKGVDGKRILAAEIMLCTQAIRANILQNQLTQITQTMGTGRSEGHLTMNQALEGLCRAGRITQDAALMASSKRDELLKQLQSHA